MNQLVLSVLDKFNDICKEVPKQYVWSLICLSFGSVFIVEIVFIVSWIITGGNNRSELLDLIRTIKGG